MPVVYRIYVVYTRGRSIREDGYWASYNRPAYEDHQEKVGGTEKVAEFGDWFTHEDTARAKIFRRDHGKVVHSKKRLILFSM